MNNQFNNLVFGLSGTEITAQEKEFFLRARPLGFILFSRNIESKAQLSGLTFDLRKLFPERKIFIFVDQEGGRVARIKPPVAQKLYPEAKLFADMYLVDKIKARSAVRENYADLMEELKSFGIDSPCAPVCDVSYEGADPIIGDRAFGNNAAQVVDLCDSAIEGIIAKGGVAFLKHIPGHGRAEVDSHVELPIVNTDLKTLEETDFKVFKELSNKKEVWGMSAHIVYKALDPENPATLSPIVISYIRDNIGFKSILVTDDIGMYALHGKTGSKKFLLESIMKLASEGKAWKNKYGCKLGELFGSGAHDLADQEIIRICAKALSAIQPVFCQSLERIARQAIKAGCDVVLHCSGDLEEMKATYAGYSLIDINLLTNQRREMTYCNHSNQKKYPFILPELPYGMGDFKPHFTPETFEYHYNKHHQAYVTNLNKLLEDDKELQDKDLESVILASHKSNAAIFNNAAQVWNHTFFWNSIKPKGGGKPSGEILAQIEKDFESYEKFVAEFKQAAVSQFGSGWAWLGYKNSKLHILKTSNAETPITDNYEPIIACDVWEHAYYIDYRNKRPDYVSTFIDHMINWEFAGLHLAKGKKQG